MNIRTGVAAALLLICANSAQAAGSPAENTEALDEIIVADHANDSENVGVDIAGKLLVDTAIALKDVPGANVNQNGALTGIAQYRGMYGDRVAITIDNHTVVSGGPNAMDSPLSYVSPMIAESITVNRGIASVSSAPESIGGHMTASLNRGQFGGNEFGVSGFAGSRYASNGDIMTSAARVTVSDSMHRFALLAEMDSGNDLSTPSGTIKPSGLNRDRYDVSYALTNGDSHLVLFAGRLDTKDSGTPALAMDIRKIETDLFGGHFLYQIAPAISIEGRGSFNDVVHTMDNFTLRGAPPAAMQRLNSAEGQGRSFAVAGNFELDKSIIRFGLDGIFAKHDSTITNPNNAAFSIRNFSGVRRDVLGVFAEWALSRERSDLELGLRFKRTNTEANEVSTNGIPMPAAAMLRNTFNGSDRELAFDDYDAVAKYRYRSSDQLEWQVGIARKSRAPSYQELYLWLPLQATGGLADGRTYIGDINLESEYANELSFGIVVSNKQFTISPQVFIKSVDGYIQGTPTTNSAANMMSMMMSGQPALQFANTDARLWGADIAWDYSLADHWQIDGTVTYVRGERRDISDELYRLAPPNANVGVLYRGAAWTAGARLAAYARQDKVSTTSNETESAGYATLSTEFSWQPVDNLRFEARVHNLLDRSYADHLAGVNRAAASDISVGQRLPGAERSVTIGAILNF